MRLELSDLSTPTALKVIIEDNNAFVTGEDLLEMFISAARAMTYNESVINEAILAKADSLNEQ